MVPSCILVCGIVCNKVLLPETTRVFWNRVVKMGQKRMVASSLDPSWRWKDDVCVFVCIYIYLNSDIRVFLICERMEYGLLKTCSCTKVSEICLFHLDFATHPEHRLHQPREQDTWSPFVPPLVIAASSLEWSQKLCKAAGSVFWDFFIVFEWWNCNLTKKSRVLAEDPGPGSMLFTVF